MLACIPMREYSFVDLFTGAGGFTEGMLLSASEEARFRLIAASDIHKHAELTHTNRYARQFGIPYSFLCKDIRSGTFVRDLSRAVEIHNQGRQIDVIVGGPPCQGFSVFGARRESDPRNDLFQHYLRVIAALRPKYFVMENVPGLATMYEGRAVDRVHEQVKRLREYEIEGPITVNAATFGVPQKRERIVFVGNRRDMNRINTIPNDDQPRISVKEAIGDLAFLRPWESATQYDPAYPSVGPYQQDSRSGRLSKILTCSGGDPLKLTNHQAARHTPEIIARFAMIKPGCGFDSVPRELWERYLASSKKWCVKLNPDDPAFTVVTLPDDFVHYEQPRILSVREMARLQSFDDSFEFLGPRSSGGGGKGNKKRNVELPQYSQVGNAVPPLMAKALGICIMRALESQATRIPTCALPSRLHRAVSASGNRASA